MNLRFQLQTLKKGNLSIDEYALKMKSFVDVLRAAGHDLRDDDDVVMYLLGGLSSVYDVIVVNLTTSSTPLSLTEVLSVLQMHEMRLLQSSNQVNISSNALANLATRDANDGGYNKGKSTFNIKNKVVCQICGKNNHVAFKCYKRFDTSYQRPDTRQQPSGNNFTPQP